MLREDGESCELNDRHVEVRVSSKQRMQAVGLVDAMMVRWQGRIERLLALGAREERQGPRERQSGTVRDKVQDTL